MHWVFGQTTEMLKRLKDLFFKKDKTQNNDLLLPDCDGFFFDKKQIRHKIRILSDKIKYAIPVSYNHYDVVWMLDNLKKMIFCLEDYSPKEVKKLRVVMRLAKKIQQSNTLLEQQQAIAELSMFLKNNK